MTISSATNKSGPYTENGVTTDFAYEFKIEDESHIKVVRAASGVETVLTLTTDYTVTGVGDDAGGNVVINTPVSGSTLTLVLDVPFTQELDLQNQGAFFAERVEAAFDLAAQRDKQLSEKIDRAVVVPVSSEAADIEALIGGVTALLGSVDEVVAVAGIASEVETVAGIAADVTTVAGIAANVTTVAAIAADVTAVAAVAADVTTVADNIADVSAAAADIASLAAKLNKDGSNVGDAAAQGVLRANVGVDVLGGFRNKLIDGDFDIWQRNTSFTATGYTADRWYMSLGTGAAITASRQAFTLGQSDVPGNPQYFMRLNRGTTGSSVSLLMQLIEGVRTLAGKLVTLTFYAKASSAVNIESYIRQYFGSGGSPSANVDTANEVHALTTSWQKFSYTKTLASISGKTLGSNGNDALRPTFSLPTAAGAVTVDIAHVSLVEGDATSEADPFSPRHIQQELALCQRYYWTASNINIVFPSYLASGDTCYSNIDLPVNMRTSPTVGASGATNIDRLTSVSLAATSPGVIRLQWNVNSGQGRAGVTGMLVTADAEL